MSNTTPAGMMTTAEAAAYCGLATMTLHNYRHTGRGPVGSKVGHRVYYSADALDAWNRERVAAKAAPRKPRAKRNAAPRRPHLPRNDPAPPGSRPAAPEKS